MSGLNNSGVVSYDGTCPSIIEISGSTPHNPGIVVGDLAIDYTNGIIFRWDGANWVNILQGGTSGGNITGTITPDYIPFCDASDDLADTIYSYDSSSGTITGTDSSNNNISIQPSLITVADNLGNFTNIETGEATFHDASGNNCDIAADTIDLYDTTSDTNRITATLVRLVNAASDTTTVTAGDITVYTASDQATTEITGSEVNIHVIGVSSIILNASTYQIEIAQTGGQDFILKPNQSVTNGITVQAPPVTGIMAVQVTGKFSVTGGVGQTVFNIAHGASYTPTYASVTAGSAGASGAHWISAISSADITVTFAVSPGAVNVTFYWQIMP